MKTNPFCFLVLFGTLASNVASPVSTNWRFGSMGPESNDIAPIETFNMPGNWRGSSLLEVEDQGAAALQRQTLLARYRPPPRMGMPGGNALEEQQRMLTMLRQREEALLEKAKALDSTPDPSNLEPIVSDINPLRRLDEKRAFSTEGKHRRHRHHHHYFARFDYDESEDDFWERQNEQFYKNVIGICFYLLTMTIAGILYTSCIEKQVGPKLVETEVRTDDWQYGPFDCQDLCGQDLYICLCATCFEWVRWADTASHPQVDFLAFWPGLFITALLSSCGAITFGLTLPILLLVVLYCRARIRVAYGLPNGTCSILCQDCCLWFWCPCCAIVQEARQVEYVESKLVPYYEEDRNPFESYPNSSASLASA